MKKLLLFVLAALLVGASCVVPGVTGDGKATVSIHVPVTQAKSLARAALGTVADIESVSITVTEESDSGTTVLIDHQDLTRDETGFSGTLAQLPVGTSLTFSASALNSVETEIFTGSVTVELAEGANTVTLGLEAVDDGTDYQFPSLKKLALAQAPAANGEVAVSLQVKGRASSSLSYAVTADRGSFSPATGSIDLDGNGSGAADLVYTAPATQGTTTVTIALTDNLHQTIRQEVSFFVNPVGSAVLNLKFGPAIQGISGSRSGSTVTWEAEVSDDGGSMGLTSEWTFNGEPLSTKGTAGFQLGYDETVTGVVHVTVTDEDGLSSQAQFNLVEGQFPDNPVVIGTPEPLPFDSLPQEVQSVIFASLSSLSIGNAFEGLGMEPGTEVLIDEEGNHLETTVSWTSDSDCWVQNFSAVQTLDHHQAAEGIVLTGTATIHYDLGGTGGDSSPTWGLLSQEVDLQITGDQEFHLQLSVSGDLLEGPEDFEIHLLIDGVEYTVPVS